MSTSTVIQFIHKRNGDKVPYDLSKWQAQIAKVCEGIADVSPSMIEIAAQPQFYEGMSTREMDKMALKAMVDLIDEEENPEVGHVNYQYVAGRQRISMLRKDVYGDYVPPTLYEIVRRNVVKGFYTPELLEWFSPEEWDELDRVIDHEKDEAMPYAAVDQMIEKYLVQNRATGEVLETPQVRYMVVAATMFGREKTAKERMKYTKEFYQASSDNMFTLATPVLAGVGSKTKQFSSCVLLRSDDTLKSIFATGEVMAEYAAKRAGIGLEFGRMRPLGAAIRGGEVMHTGIVPFLKKWFHDLRSCSQGGIRNASATVNLPIWHYQFDDYIVLKNNKGIEENRVRQLDYCVVLNAFFWRRYKKRGTITLFDPNEVPDLYEAFYRDTDLFEKLYVQYEQKPGLRTKKFDAVDLMNRILVERSETGRIYLLNIDNVQRQGPFDTLVHPIYQTNLCTEIMLHTRPFQRVDDEDGRIALCTLSSVNLGAFRHPEDMRRAVRILHRGLHNLLQYQDFLTVQSRKHNEEFEPLGIGITNLAYWHAKRKWRYGEPEALAEVKRWMEHLAFYTTEMSVELAEEKGPCLESAKTWYGKGVFPWERRAKGVNELTDFTPELPWEPLRERMKKSGVRNSTNIAIAPVESSSVILNSTNGVNFVKSLIVTKSSKAGYFVQVVPEYRKLKKYYQPLMLWNQTDCVDYLKTVAVAQVYTDQGISADTFYSSRHFPNGKIPLTLIAKNLMLAHRWGLKSHYYDLREKQASQEALKAEIEEAPLTPKAQQEVRAQKTFDAHIALGVSSKAMDIEEPDDCEACKL